MLVEGWEEAYILVSEHSLAECLAEELVGFEVWWEQVSKWVAPSLDRLAIEEQG